MFDQSMHLHAGEVSRGERFRFGANWARFLAVLDDTRISRAESSLCTMLGEGSLPGRTFLDIGSGSGLFSLAARRLGACVHSFDYDPQSVACTEELRHRYFPGDPGWVIEAGSVLDARFVDSLGRFDVVYSWGVLHHTGDMWRALEHAARLVAPGGRLFIAIYNDTGSQSARWASIKRAYNRLPGLLRPAYTAAVIAPQEAKSAIRAIVGLHPGEYLRSWTDYDRQRGMSKWRDAVDWVGGYPYETARPDQIFDFYRARRFTLEKLRTGAGLGCNEYVFQAPR